MNKTNSKTYTPTPQDTSKVILSAELLALAEAMAENVHEVWAERRIADGWTFGPVRDDTRKQTPCLVPYADLPEIEKEYDRSTALETLRFIVSRGYVIEKP